MDNRFYRRKVEIIFPFGNNCTIQNVLDISSIQFYDGTLLQLLPIQSKHMKYLPYLIGLLTILIIFPACQNDDNNGEEMEEEIDTSILSEYLDLPETPFNYADIPIPTHISNPPVIESDNTPAANPITDYGATLGRVLFYDPMLSANNTISCSSCHLQEFGFSDPESFSIGFEGGTTPRNSMGLANARFYENGRFFWDERAATLEDQVLLPIQDHIEMGMELDDLTTKLAATEYYPVLFRLAFGEGDITSEKISLALSQFVRSIVSFDSKFDQALAGTTGPPPEVIPGFTPQEQLGHDLFHSPVTNCSNCHSTTLQIGREATNNGLDVVYADNGLGEVTGNPADDGKFKVPSLRNVALTGPFMHDGRFKSLTDVIVHYNSGIAPHPNLDNRLRLPSGDPRHMSLDAEDIAALVAFLNTLTDEGLKTDEKYSDPFR